MIALLSPAKTLDFAAAAGRSVPQTTLPAMAERADALVRELRAGGKAGLKKLLGISDSLAELNIERFRAFELHADEPAPARSPQHQPAALCYNGPAFQGLDALSMSDAELERAQGRLRVLSGLYGAVRPLDLIQPYRLCMGTKLKGGPLYDFWGSSIAEAVLAEDPEVVVNVASDEYYRSVKPHLEGAVRVVKCSFSTGGSSAAVYSKKARGLMARYIIVSNAQTVEDLHGFDLEGYAFDAEASSEDDLVFRRSKAPPTAAKKRAAAAAGAAAPKKRRKAS